MNNSNNSSNSKTNKVNKKNLHVMFEVTQSCNNNCIYCYNVWKAPEGYYYKRDSQSQNEYPRGELAIEKVKNLLEKLTVSANPTSITLTGGEPLLRDDLEQIASCATALNMRVSIATNGVLLDKSRIKNLIDAGVVGFEIPLLSANADLHNRLTGNDSYDKACEAVTYIKMLGTMVEVVFVAMRMNIADFGDVAQLSFALGADTLKINRFVPGGEGAKHAKELEPSKAELAKLLEEAQETSEKLGTLISLGIPMPHGLFEKKDFPRVKFGTCGAGQGKWALDSLGNVRACEQQEKILGNLFETPFTEIASRLKNDPDSYCQTSCNL